MALFEIQRRCNDCERTHSALESLRLAFAEDQRRNRDEIDVLRRSIDQFALDYQSLYEKVRTNLSKLAKRAAESEREAGAAVEEHPDQLSLWRKALVERKLGRRAV